MKNRIAITAFLLISFSLNLMLAPDASRAQQKSASEKSYKQARQILEAGLDALGGLDAIAAIRNFTMEETGKSYDVDQSPDPELPRTTADLKETTIIDFSGSRLFYEIRQVWPNYIYHLRTIINGSVGFRLDLLSKAASPINAPSLRNFSQLIQKLPHFLLRDALTERAASLRWLGQSVEQGRRQQVITFVNREGQQVTMYFDARTRLLSKYEFLYTDSGAGDSRQEYLFSGWRDAGALKVPTRLTVRLANRLARDIRYDRIEINSSLDRGLFDLPEGIEKVPAPPAPVQPYSMTPIAKDVYLIQRVGNFNNVLAVAFNDYILVIEAPEARVHSRASEQVIARIKETIPGKPIKYLVFTHHHLDHGCGARAYIAEGATIVTTPGNRQFVERLAAAPFTLAPDDLARNPRKPAIEIIENKKRVLRDDRHVVELYDIGPYWHAKEELIIYLPQEKLLYEGDLFTSGQGDNVPIAQEKTVLLADKIKQLGLDVEKIVGAHGRLRPIEELHHSIEKRNRRMQATGAK